VQSNLLQSVIIVLCSFNHFSGFHSRKLAWGERCQSASDCRMISSNSAWCDLDFEMVSQSAEFL
jgi:hypothetical protein